nr:hypothetical protein StreXyl84_14380 [Streptomyces sp. Xyl84]
MKISFLINNIYGIGGTNRTVINLAEALSVHHDVEIVSVFRRATATKFEISPRITVRALVDLRPGGADRGAAGSDQPSEVVPRQEEFYAQYSKFTDARIIRELEKTSADVVVGTRPSLNLFVAAHTRDGALRVAQEHMTHLAIPPAVRAEMARVYPRLDAITTVTEADARSFQENTPIPGIPVTGIPNSVPEPAVTPSDGTRKIVVSAGRMHHIKRYDLLIRAFAAGFPATLPVVFAGDLNLPPGAPALSLLRARFAEAGGDRPTAGGRKIDYVFADRRHFTAAGGTAHGGPESDQALLEGEFTRRGRT